MRVIYCGEYDKIPTKMSDEGCGDPIAGTYTVIIGQDGQPLKICCRCAYSDNAPDFIPLSKSVKKWS